MRVWPSQVSLSAAHAHATFGEKMVSFVTKLNPLRLGGPEKATCREVREIAAQHLDDIRAKIDDLKKLERLLSKTVALCSGKTAPDCPVLDVLDIQRSK